MFTTARGIHECEACFVLVFPGDEVAVAPDGTYWHTQHVERRVDLREPEYA